MPNRVRITTSCCQINCGGQGDISINVQYTKPPKINHDLVSKVCERPAVVARCPVAAIRPAMVNGKPSLEVDEQKCVCCGACYPPCPPMQINGAELHQDRGVGRRQAFQRALASRPSISSSWPTCRTTRRAGRKSPRSFARSCTLTRSNAKDWERMGEWIERIGWPRFFELTGFAFTKHHLDTWTGARKTMNMSAHVHF